MPLDTTTIGSYRKDLDRNPYQDWFSDPNMDILNAQAAWKAVQDMDPDRLERLMIIETTRMITAQTIAGIDIPTDGEARRISYVHYPCQHMGGIDMDDMTRVTARDGKWYGYVPTIKGEITHQDEHYLPHDYEVAKDVTNKPIKITSAGPMTIADSLADKSYGADPLANKGRGNDKYWNLVKDLAVALNWELRALADAGCPYIQIDEPVFARYPDRALHRGFETLEMVLEGIPAQNTKVLHLCCGYPLALDDETYEKADNNAYRRLADAIERSSVQQVSLEHAHFPMDLSVLRQFEDTQVILGMVAVAKSRVEEVEEIKWKLQEARHYIDADRLLAAPDCGLGFLPHERAQQKLRNMAEAAHSIR